MSVTGVCPECRQTVTTDAGDRNIDFHIDKAGKPCGTVGLPFRIALQVGGL